MARTWGEFRCKRTRVAVVPNAIVQLLACRTEVAVAFRLVGEALRAEQRTPCAPPGTNIIRYLFTYIYGGNTPSVTAVFLPSSCRFEVQVWLQTASLLF